MKLNTFPLAVSALIISHRIYDGVTVICLRTVYTHALWTAAGGVTFFHMSPEKLCDAPVSQSSDLNTRDRHGRGRRACACVCMAACACVNEGVRLIEVVRVKMVPSGGRSRWRRRVGSAVGDREGLAEGEGLGSKGLLLTPILGGSDT